MTSAIIVIVVLGLLIMHDIRWAVKSMWAMSDKRTEEAKEIIAAIGRIK